MSRIKFVKWILFLVLILNVNTMNAQNNADSLNPQQQSLVTISALTATGDLDNLKTELNTALDTELTINEIKEALVQLYAYCGFPRSLNALGTFQTVLEERKTKGITDKEGKEIVVENNVSDKYRARQKSFGNIDKNVPIQTCKRFRGICPTH